MDEVRQDVGWQARGWRVGFTGTQHGIRRAQRESLLFVLARARIAGALWMHNGDCLGADDTAGRIWRSLGGKIHLHPPINDAKRARMNFDETAEPKPYLDRNHDIVDASAELFATPCEMFEWQRSGTWATIRYARKIGRAYTIIWPNGAIEPHPTLPEQLPEELRPDAISEELTGDDNV